jgi:hypothetical protein
MGNRDVMRGVGRIRVIIGCDRRVPVVSLEEGRFGCRSRISSKRELVSSSILCGDIALSLTGSGDAVRKVDVCS